MTQNQISFQNYKETVRHNLATEGLTGTELGIKQDSNNINREHYSRSDTAALMTADANMRNAATNAMNAYTNARNADTQQYNAMTNRLNYGVNVRNADINARNAESNAINAAANQRNANTNFLNYTVNLQNAETNARNADSNALQADAAWQQAQNGFLMYGLQDDVLRQQADAATTRAEAAAALVDSQNFSNYGRGAQGWANAVSTVLDEANGAMQSLGGDVMSFPSSSYYLLGN